MLHRKSLSFNLEPTFRCNLECAMCPRFSSEDPHLDMSMETYGRICEAMSYAHTIDFTGWGEPMLHRQIYEMIQLAKERGCVTTMTSNGTLLTDRNIKALIQAGMDSLTISIDGLTPETFDFIRTGARFERVTQNLKNLSRQVNESSSPLLLGIAFTIQEANASELGLILPWMKSVGARVLHLKHLNVVSNRQDWERSFLKYRLTPQVRNGTALGELEDKIAELRQDAERVEVRMLMLSESPLTSEKKGRHCLATPLQSVYFSYEGKMSPCCHFGHEVSRYFEDQFYRPSSLFFGDIRKQSFIHVWNDPAFQAFRQGFVTENFPDPCKTCYLLYGK